MYAKRGYPLDLVKGWLRKYSAERWNKRLNEEKDSSRNEVLVLKSEFNTSWNYFSASQLGDTIIGFWREWLIRAERNQFSIAFPKFSGRIGDLKDVSEKLNSLVSTSDGLRPVPDLRKIGFLDRRMIVSRKRTRNLFDLTSLWKKMVLSGYDKEASNQVSTAIDTHFDGDNDDYNVDQDIVETSGFFDEWNPLLERGVFVRDGSPPRVGTHILGDDGYPNPLR